MESRPPTPLHWFVLVFLATVWGMSFFAIKKAVQVFDPVQMGMWRTSLSSVLYFPLGLLYWKKIDWSKWPYFLVVAVCGSALPTLLFGLAQRHVGSGLAGVLNSLTPLFTLMLGAAAFGMRVTLPKALGVLLGFFGACALILFNSSRGVEGNAFYAALCGLATLNYAVNANIVGKYLQGQHPAAIASSAFMLTGPASFAGLWWSGGWEAAMTPAGTQALGYVLYLAVLGTVVSNVLYFWLLQGTSALFATSVTYLVPVAALVIGLADGELLGWGEITGTAVILTGLYLARR